MDHPENVDRGMSRQQDWGVGQQVRRQKRRLGEVLTVLWASNADHIPQRTPAIQPFLRHSAAFDHPRTTLPSHGIRDIRAATDKIMIFDRRHIIYVILYRISFGVTNSITCFNVTREGLNLKVYHLPGATRY
ncbi:hypothetical protein ALC56_00807 [Trachymyrmex septentrionalis]|uniref:Uncharacterized protein n=1 Tax=Trachymyrmex septentrionalis TaxID=34720 RepID=A0A195FWW7_9HYME|nr:hypothetical protein ALC56_00807 [Trachymyrmex septentrionalis]